MAEAVAVGFSGANGRGHARCGGGHRNQQHAGTDRDRLLPPALALRPAHRRRPRRSRRGEGRSRLLPTAELVAVRGPAPRLPADRRHHQSGDADLPPARALLHAGLRGEQGLHRAETVPGLRPSGDGGGAAPESPEPGAYLHPRRRGRRFLRGPVPGPALGGRARRGRSSGGAPARPERHHRIALHLRHVRRAQGRAAHLEHADQPRYHGARPARPDIRRCRLHALSDGASDGVRLRHAHGLPAGHETRAAGYLVGRRRGPAHQRRGRHLHHGLDTVSGRPGGHGGARALRRLPLPHVLLRRRADPAHPGGERFENGSAPRFFRDGG